MTACEAAGGDPEADIACAFSKKISRDGVLIANRKIVSGADTVFEAHDSTHTWVAYQDGKIVMSPKDIPIQLTMKDAYVLCEMIRAEKSDDSDAPVIGITFSEWFESSEKMTALLAHASEKEGNYRLFSPHSFGDFSDVWNSARGLMMFHTSGDSNGCYNRIGEAWQNIVTLADTEKLLRNRNIRFIMTVAGANAKETTNIARAMSEKISPRGIVIANTKGPVGADSEFWSENGEHGWVVYQNGKILIDPESLPKALDMKDAYMIFKTLTSMRTDRM